MFKLKKGHQPGVYVPLRALFLVLVRSHRTNRFLTDSDSGTDIITSKQ